MSEFITVSQLADILGISRVAVLKKIKKGQIKAIRIGHNYAIPKKYIDEIMGKSLSKKEKQLIRDAVKKTVKEYGEVLKKLGST